MRSSLALLLLATGTSCSAPLAPESEPIAVRSTVAVAAPSASIGIKRGSGCPAGMVLVQGTGVIGMRGQPYGVVRTGHLARVDAPELGCGEAVARTPGATACWVQTDEVDPVLRPRAVAVPEFCIEALPFPGAGAPYATDGLTTWGAARLDELLQTGRFGTRRMCTSTELQLAVAGPLANSRFVYGDIADPARCPANGPIGADPSCRNLETGVHEYGAIHSHWTRADGDFVAAACDAPPCSAAGNRDLSTGMYIVVGGTSRVQTRQAPLTPHTWHDHGDPSRAPCSDRGWDDQPVICATPEVSYDAVPLSAARKGQDDAWSKVIAVARSTGRVADALTFGLGRVICD
jgi:hypothetical protein